MFPVVYFLSQKLTSIVLKDPLVLKVLAPESTTKTLSTSIGMFLVAMVTISMRIEYELRLPPRLLAH